MGTRPLWQAVDACQLLIRLSQDYEMTDTVQQAAAAVEGDVKAVQTVDATSGVVAAVEVAGTEVAGIAGQAIDAGAEGADSLANEAPVVESEADGLFAKVKEEIEGLIDLAETDWALLKAAIVKHL